MDFGSTAPRGTTSQPISRSMGPNRWRDAAFSIPFRSPFRGRLGPYGDCRLRVHSKTGNVIVVAGTIADCDGVFAGLLLVAAGCPSGRHGRIPSLGQSCSKQELGAALGSSRTVSENDQRPTVVVDLHGAPCISLAAKVDSVIRVLTSVCGDGFDSLPCDDVAVRAAQSYTKRSELVLLPAHPDCALLLCNCTPSRAIGFSKRFPLLLSDCGRCHAGRSQWTSGLPYAISRLARAHVSVDARADRVSLYR